MQYATAAASLPGLTLLLNWKTVYYPLNVAMNYKKYLMPSAMGLQKIQDNQMILFIGSAFLHTSPP